VEPHENYRRHKGASSVFRTRQHYKSSAKFHAPVYEVTWDLCTPGVSTFVLPFFFACSYVKTGRFQKYFFQYGEAHKINYLQEKIVAGFEIFENYCIHCFTATCSTAALQTFIADNSSPRKNQRQDKLTPIVSGNKKISLYLLKRSNYIYIELCHFLFCVFINWKPSGETERYFKILVLRS